MVVALLFHTSPLAVTDPRLVVFCPGHPPVTQSLQVTLEVHRTTVPLWASCKLELFGAESAEPIVDEGQELSLEVFLRNGV